MNFRPVDEPFNTTAPQSTEPEPDPEPDDDGDEDRAREQAERMDRVVEAHKSLLMTTYTRILRTEHDKVTRAEKKAQTPGDFDISMNHFFTSHQSHIYEMLRDAMSPCIEALAALSGVHINDHHMDDILCGSTLRHMESSRSEYKSSIQRERWLPEYPKPGTYAKKRFSEAYTLQSGAQCRVAIPDDDPFYAQRAIDQATREMYILQKKLSELKAQETDHE